MSETCVRWGGRSPEYSRPGEQVRDQIMIMLSSDYPSLNYSHFSVEPSIVAVESLSYLKVAKTKMGTPRRRQNQLTTLF